MFGLQPLHLIIIGVIALLIFGPARFGDIGRSVGTTLREFRAASKGQEPDEEVKK
jgi:sec-independent protein translocase protein TatA